MIRFTKLLLVTIIAFATLVSPNVWAASTTPIFIDVPQNHWAIEYINEGFNDGLLKGFDDNSFRPNQGITGAEFMTLLVKSMNLSVLSSNPTTQWYEPYITTARSVGIYQDDYTHDWNEPLLRNDMAITLFRATEKGIEEELRNEEKRNFIDSIKSGNLNPLLKIDIHGHLEDASSLEEMKQKLTDYLPTIRNELSTDNVTYSASALRDYVQRGIEQLDRALNRIHAKTILPREQMIYEVFKRGLLTGQAAGDIALDDATTRAQALAVLARVKQFNNGKQLKADKYALSTAEINWHKTNIVTMLPRYFSNGIGEFKGNDFKADRMKFTADDGNFVNEIKQLVVVDMSDLNDPNRKLVPDDLMWRGWDHKRKWIPSESYVILGLNHIKVSKKYGISPNYQFGRFSPSSRIEPKDVDLKTAYASDPDTLLALEPAYSVSKGGDAAIEINYLGHEFETLKEQDYITAFVIPKGDLYSTNGVFSIDYDQSSDFGGKPVRLLQSKLDPNIHQ
ncbi:MULTISPECIES: S-layer homology domain-containing protein [unclassified Paenibacillus]|uniref:S-layer homology domain-containing protein n=1 Tax=unclassified Paenibacillus TaxID=185978 RepID=UPI00277D6393|nr:MULTISPECIES: S-layer homology domain-containing protein [unclassified Paenibacillus]MDQ0896308.1 hypothetical protein [Paenibacillus sp. V4I7]MDQ0913764.1 hypothetical protein [Paenibacillus sp. V4I5]